MRIAKLVSRDFSVRDFPLTGSTAATGGFRYSARENPWSVEESAHAITRQVRPDSDLPQPANDVRIQSATFVSFDSPTCSAAYESCRRSKLRLASPDHLMPLIAVGAFLTFTLSQTVMVLHWLRKLRQKQHGTRRATLVYLFTNGVGAAPTACALIIIVGAKFATGAWITVSPCRPRSRC